MAIFNSYVKLPEGSVTIVTIESVNDVFAWIAVRWFGNKAKNGEKRRCLGYLVIVTLDSEVEGILWKTKAK